MRFPGKRGEVLYFFYDFVSYKKGALAAPLSALNTGYGQGSGPAGGKSVCSQLFRLVLVVKREMLCLTFLLLHFGQETLALPSSEMLKISVNFLLQSRHSYSYAACPSSFPSSLGYGEKR